MGGVLEGAAPLIVMIGATLLLILMWTILIGRNEGVRDSDDDDPSGRDRPAGLEARVERFIGLLNYGDEQTATNAMRHLLSMGPSILPILFSHLSRLEQHPGGLAPRCQLMIEQVLIDFGLQTYLQCGDAIRSVHRASPVYPALQRVLVGIGPNLLIELIRGPMLDPLVGMAPLFHRLGEPIEHPLGELLDNRVEAIPAAFLQATIPVFTAHPELLARLYVASSPAARQRLLTVLAPWTPELVQTIHPRSPPPVAPQEPTEVERSLAETALAERLLHSLNSPTDLDIQVRHGLALTEESSHKQALLAAVALPPNVMLQALEEHPGALEPDLHTHLQALLDPAGEPREQVEQALSMMDEPAAYWTTWVGMVGLGARLGDPRAEARLLHMAEDPSQPLGGLALMLLTMRPPEGLGDVLARRVRSARTHPLEPFQLRLACVKAPEQFEAILVRLLRADAARVVSCAALLLAPLRPPIDKLLKALGRHRGSPLEAQVAPLLWSQWPTCRAAVLRALKDSDREVREAAVTVLGALGSPEDVPALLDGLGPASESVEARLNAVEMLGPSGLGLLQECMERDLEFAKSFTLGRRLHVLRLLAQKATRNHEATPNR
ncbi:MAG: HEAT repeat domain-containing protein [Myxococcota bacterium]